MNQVKGEPVKESRSTCCSSPPNQLGLCSACGEHTDFEDEEVESEEPTLDDQLRGWAAEAGEHFSSTNISPTGEDILDYVLKQWAEDSGLDVDSLDVDHAREVLGTPEELEVEEAIDLNSPTSSIVDRLLEGRDFSAEFPMGSKVRYRNVPGKVIKSTPNYLEVQLDATGDRSSQAPKQAVHKFTSATPGLQDLKLGEGMVPDSVVRREPTWLSEGRVFGVRSQYGK